MNQTNNTPVIDKLAVNENELSAMIGVGVKKLRADRCKGSGIPFFKMGRLVRYRVKDVRSHIDSLIVNSTSEAA